LRSTMEQVQVDLDGVSAHGRAYFGSSVF